MQTERQIQIMESALELIAEKGIQGLTIKNLSKKIGVSEPAIYRHYENKSAILIAILNNFKEMSSMMAGMIPSMDGTAFDKICFMFSKVVDLFIESPSYVSVIFSEEVFKSDEMLKSKIVEVLKQNELTVEEIIKIGQQHGEVRDDAGSRYLALIVMGSLRFLVKQWDIMNSDNNLLKEKDELLNSLRLLISK